MAAMTFSRLSWTIERAILRRGVSAIIFFAGVLVLAALLAALIWSAVRTQRADDALAERIDALRTIPAVSRGQAQDPALPLPAMTRRFTITARLLSILKKTGLEPEQMRFKFESAEDAGLLRQTAIFTLKGRWADIARTLAQLQAADRAAYVSKLRVSRDSVDDENVSAEIQLTVVMTDPAAAGDAGAGR